MAGPSPLHAAQPRPRATTPTGAPFAVLDRKVVYMGKDVFREGQVGRNAYIVESGEVEVWKKLGQRRVVLGRVGRGGVFGEMALIDDAPRMATATAVVDTVCVVVPEATLRRKLAATDPFMRALVRIMVRNVRSLTQDKMVGEAIELGPDVHLID